MQLGVRRLQVVELYWFAEQLLVKRQGEAAVDVVAVENRQSHHAAHEVEVRQVVLGDGAKRERQVHWFLMDSRGLLALGFPCAGTHWVDGGVGVDL